VVKVLWKNGEFTHFHNFSYLFFTLFFQTHNPYFYPWSRPFIFFERQLWQLWDILIPNIFYKWPLKKMMKANKDSKPESSTVEPFWQHFSSPVGMVSTRQRNTPNSDEVLPSKGRGRWYEAHGTLLRNKIKYKHTVAITPAAAIMDGG
jgi:hypothetical protein